MTPFLTEAQFDRWMAELRGGMYTQGEGALCSRDRFCCLGVLCDIIDPSKWQEVSCGYGWLAWENEETVLPASIRGYGNTSAKTVIINVGRDNCITLAGLNDNYHLTFPQIAAVCCYYSDQIIKKET